MRLTSSCISSVVIDTSAICEACDDALSDNLDNRKHLCSYTTEIAGVVGEQNTKFRTEDAIGRAVAILMEL